MTKPLRFSSFPSLPPCRLVRRTLGSVLVIGSLSSGSPAQQAGSPVPAAPQTVPPTAPAQTAPAPTPPATPAQPSSQPTPPKTGPANPNPSVPGQPTTNPTGNPTANPTGAPTTVNPPPKPDDTRRPQGVGNPLLLSSPENANAPILYYDRNGRRINRPQQGQGEFGTYQRGPIRTSAEERSRALSDFAENFFEYPRQLILSRRASLQRQYEPRPPAGVPESVPTDAGGTTVPATVPPTVPSTVPSTTVPPTAVPPASASPTVVSPIAVSPTGAPLTVPVAAPAPVLASAVVVPPAAPTGTPTDAFREFADPLSQLSRNVSASVPADYLLAPGDRLTVRFGSATLATREFVRTVDSQGNLSVEGLGRVNVAGQTLERAERLLTRSLARLYRGVRAEIALTELRTINVTITGDAFAPGTYTIPSVATAFNLLYAAGGPTAEGTLRRIRVLRRGRVVGELDFYAFLTGSGRVADIPLQSGDVLNIPGRLSRVTIEGEVRRPAIFELTERETLQDALRFAGGVKASAVDQRVQITTVDPGAARVLRDINLRDRGTFGRLPIYDGDIVSVFSVRPQVTNLVTIEGAVDQPGDYALAPGMRVSDLVRRSRGILNEAYPERADLYRWQPDNTLRLVRIDLAKALGNDPEANVSLQRWDRLRIYSRQEVEWTGRREVTIRGAVQRPGIYDRSDGMRIRDLLLMAGGPTPEAYLPRAFLLHQRPDASFSYREVRVGEAIKGNPEDDVLLEDNDVLAIYRVNEAQFQPEHVVTITGEVVSPGIYPRGDGMKITDLVRLAGGFKPSAAGVLVQAHGRRSPESADPRNPQRPPVTVPFDRTGTIPADADRPLDDGDVITVQSLGGYKERVEIVYVRGAVANPGPIVVTSNKMHLSEAIAAAGGLRPEAFPEGTEFDRKRELIASEKQRSLTALISQLNDILNRDTFQREQAKADVERLKTISQATSSSNSTLIPGLGGSTPASSTAVNVANNLPPRDLVTAPRSLGEDDLVPGGSLAVDLPQALLNPKSAEDVILMDGDVITIPETPSTVQVVGAVTNGRGVVYRAGATPSYYIERTGGFTRDAATDRVIVIRYGGGILPLNKVKSIRPGDIILVPTKVLAPRLSSGNNPFESFIRSLAGTAITIRVLDSLFR
ncbi:MAG: SLBB domain-containing protein [Capsulimonadales bacterium]|nr:SLBB domain-containing protein [Capsulimonadales bacterium]